MKTPIQWLQHLLPSPSTVHRPRATASSQPTAHRPLSTGRHWIALPNFVDCDVFRPVADAAGKRAVRTALGVPSDTLVVGCVAAVKKNHKRIDYLIREFHQWAVDSRQSTEALNPRVNRPPYTVHRPQHSGYLLIAGAKTGETDELITLAESLIPGRYKILTDLGRDRMPDLYRAMDVFVLPSLFEMMPIAILEGLASGLPVITNNHPVMMWMTGGGEEKILPRRHGDTEKNNVAGISPVGEPTAKIPATLSGGIQGERGDVQQSEPLLPPDLSPVEGLAVSSFKEPFGEFSGCGTPQAENSPNICFSSLLGVSACPAKHGISGRRRVPLAKRVVNSSSSVGGMAIDMSRDGELASALGALTLEWVAEHGRQARERALQMFSKEVVISQYVDYYRQVLADGE